MALKDTVNRAFSSWMSESGPDKDVVISSRVRVARNLSHFAFPHMLPVDRAQEVIHAVSMALSRSEVNSQVGELEVNAMTELNPIDRQILLEKHLISNDLLQNHEKKAVALNDGEDMGIMINEEDHLRIQSILPGLQLDEAWEKVNSLDDNLEKNLDFSFSEKLGYLTACPTNVGTGLRASVMVHLPGLVIANQIQQVLASVSKLGLAVRGTYGEGTQAVGNLFQISNQVTLGHAEKEIIQNLLSVTKQLLEQERAARQALYRDRLEQIEDRIGRSYGILKHSRIISSEEAMQRLSDLLLGADLGIITGVTPQAIIELMVLTRQPFLIKKAGKELSAFERDVNRAELLRKTLTSE